MIQSQEKRSIWSDRKPWLIVWLITGPDRLHPLVWTPFHWPDPPWQSSVTNYKIASVLTFSVFCLFVCLFVCLYVMFLYPSLYEPIMDRFQFLRCLHKCFDEMFKSIISKFSKIKNFTYPLKFLIPISHHLEAYFILIYSLGSYEFTKKIQLNLM